MKRNMFGLLSRILGIISMIMCCFVNVSFAIAVLAIILGIVSLIIKKEETKGLAISGIICGAVVVILFLISTILGLGYGKFVPDTFEKEPTQKQIIKWATSKYGDCTVVCDLQDVDNDHDGNVNDWDYNNDGDIDVLGMGGEKAIVLHDLKADVDYCVSVHSHYKYWLDGGFGPLLYTLQSNYMSVIDTTETYFDSYGWQHYWFDSSLDRLFRLGNDTKEFDEDFRNFTGIYYCQNDYCKNEITVSILINDLSDISAVSSMYDDIINNLTSYVETRKQLPDVTYIDVQVVTFDCINMTNEDFRSETERLTKALKKLGKAKNIDMNSMTKFLSIQGLTCREENEKYCVTADWDNFYTIDF